MTKIDYEIIDQLAAAKLLGWTTMRDKDGGLFWTDSSWAPTGFVKTGDGVVFSPSRCEESLKLLVEASSKAGVSRAKIAAVMAQKERKAQDGAYDSMVLSILELHGVRPVG